MSNRLQDCLTGKDPNYLYPFLMYREPAEDLSEEDIAQAGCGGFLIETRRHSDWGGEGWRKDLGFVDFQLENCPDLMHLHMSHEGTETYFFFNLSAAQPMDAVAEFPYRGDYVLYDVWAIPPSAAAQRTAAFVCASRPRAH